MLACWSAVLSLKLNTWLLSLSSGGTQIPMVVGIRVNSVNESIICKDFSGRGNGDEMLPNCGLRQKVYQVIIFCVYGVKKRL